MLFVQKRLASFASLFCLKIVTFAPLKCYLDISNSCNKEIPYEKQGFLFSFSDHCLCIIILFAMDNGWQRNAWFL